MEKLVFSQVRRKKKTLKMMNELILNQFFFKLKQLINKLKNKNLTHRSIALKIKYYKIKYRCEKNFGSSKMMREVKRKSPPPPESKLIIL